MTDLLHLFVYGTLKKGQCREKCWPILPVSISAAWTLGELYDLGPYPALITGEACIAGQLWSYREQDILAVFHVLDRIEVTNQPSIPNLYDRVTITVFTLDDRQLQADTYLFADAQQLKKSADRVPASIVHQERPFVVWPVGAQWLPETPDSRT